MNIFFSIFTSKILANARLTAYSWSRAEWYFDCVRIIIISKWKFINLLYQAEVQFKAPHYVKKAFNDTQILFASHKKKQVYCKIWNHIQFSSPSWSSKNYITRLHSFFSRNLFQTLFISCYIELNFWLDSQQIVCRLLHFSYLSLFSHCTRVSYGIWKR